MKRNRKFINAEEQKKKLYKFGKYQKYYPAWSYLKDLIEEDAKDYEMLDNELVIPASALHEEYQRKHALDNTFKLGRYGDHLLDEIENFRLFVIEKHNTSSGAARKSAGIPERCFYQTKWKPTEEIPQTASSPTPLIEVVAPEPQVVPQPEPELPDCILDMSFKELKKIFPGQAFSSRYDKVRDIFSPDRSAGKVILATREFILSHQDDILGYDPLHVVPSSADCHSITLPTEASQKDDLKSLIREFAKEFAGTRMKEADKKIFEESYVWTISNPDQMSQADLAAAIGISGERVRQKRVEMIKECRRIILDREVVKGIKASPTICDRVAEFASRVGSTISFNTFQGLSHLDDGKTIGFLAALLGFNVSEGKYAKIRCVSRYSVTQFDHEVSSVLNFFRQEVIGLRMDVEIKSFLNKKFASNHDLLDMFTSFIANSDEFERITDLDGNENITLRWDLLQNIDSELCRILYDKGAYDIKTSIHEGMLLKLYNKYAKYHGVQKLTSVSQLPSLTNKKCWRPMTLSRTGYWKLKQSKSEKFKDLKTFAHEYVRHNREDEEGYFRAAREMGYDRIYSESTFMDSFAAAGGKKKAVKKCIVTRIVRSDAEKQAIVEYAVKQLQMTGKAMTLADLFGMVSTEYGDLNYSTFTTIMRADRSRRFTLNVGRGNRSSVIAPSGVRAEMVQNFKDKIREEAVKNLYTAPNHCIPYNDLLLRYASYVPVEQKSIPAALSKTFGDKDIFKKLKTEDGTTVLTLTSAALKKARGLFTDAPKPDLAHGKVELGYEWESLKPVLARELTIPFREAPGFDVLRSLDTALMIMKYEAADFDNTSPFADVLAMLPAHYAKTLEIDRENNLKKNCLGCIELFVKNFHMMKYGHDIASEVLTNGPVGLGTFFAILEGKGILPYKNMYDRFTLEYEIKQISQKILHARNNQLGHQSRETDKSALSIEQNIHHTLALFVWLASKL